MTTVVTFAFLLFTFPTYATNHETNPDPAQQSNDESPLKPIDAGNYGPDKHLLYTLMNLGGYAAGCLGEGSPLFGGECLDMVGGVGEKKAMGATPYLVNSSIQSGGALGALGGAMIALGTTSPTSPIQYLASIGENFGIKTAYAQVSGSGNSVIEPILKLWQLTRNIAYFGFILIFIAIGFMIMFRQKLNPQTVISAQNALPGVVVALILVTFSYFIAALIIDLGFVTTQLTGRLLSANSLASSDKVNKTLKDANIFSLFGNIMMPPGNNLTLDKSRDEADTVGDATRESLAFLQEGFVGTLVKGAITLGGCYGGGAIVASKIPAVPVPKAALTRAGAIGVGGLLGCGLGYGAAESGLIFYGLGIVLYIILLIALLIAMFKTFFELIKAYITLMMQTIFAPFIIMFGAIPGQSGGFSGWLKTMFANVLIFPAIFAGFFLAAFILNRTGEPFGIQNGSDFSTIQSTVPLFGGLTGKFIQLVLGYGILLIIPSIPGEIKKAFKVQDSPLGAAALGGVAAGYGAGKTLITKPLQPWIKQGQAWREQVLKDQAIAATKPGQQPSLFTRGVSKVFGG